MADLLELIEAHRTAIATYDACDDDDWNTRASEINALIETSTRALLDHRPISTSEVFTKAEYLASAKAFVEWDDVDVAGVIRSLTPKQEARKAELSHPDAKLLKLGEQYRAARQAEIALYQEIGDDESPETMARVDKLGFEMGRLSRAILATQPKTVDGLRVIGRVWGAHHINMDGSWPPEPAHTDTQAVHAVMRWLIEGGAPCN